MGTDDKPTFTFRTLSPKEVRKTPILAPIQMNNRTLQTIRNVDNYTGAPIVMQERNGVTTILKPKPSTSVEERGNIVITVTTIYDSTLVSPAIRTETNLPINGVEDMEERALAHSMNLSHKVYNDTDVPTAMLSEYGVMYTVPITSIMPRGDVTACYSRELDLLFSTVPQSQAPKHPFSWSSDVETYFETSFTSNRENKFALSINVIDTSNVYSRLFVNIMGNVQEVPISRKDTFGRGDGALFMITDDKGNGPFDAESNFHFYTLDELESKIDIYPTRKQAETQGCVKTRETVALKREELRLLKESNRLKLETEKEKTLEAMTRMKNDTIHAKSKYLHEERSLVRKDDYESRSIYRKDSSEAVKTTIAIVLSTITAITSGMALWSRYN